MMNTLYLIVCAVWMAVPQDSHAAAGSHLQMNCNPAIGICYTAYRTSVNQQAADAECRRAHNGRLMTISDWTTQRIIDSALDAFLPVNNGTPYINEYWLGARVKLLSNWTWLNNSMYNFTDTRWLTFQESPSASNGYAVLRKWYDTQSRINLLVEVLQIGDQPDRTGQALCKCSDCEGQNVYSTIPQMTRWNDARNSCVRKSRTTDLAVLSVKDVQYLSQLTNNYYYYIGLSKVRLIWDTTGQHQEARYTNWYSGYPTAADNDSCIFASSQHNWKWLTAPCNVSKFFICEHENISQCFTNLLLTTVGVLVGCTAVGFIVAATVWCSTRKRRCSRAGNPLLPVGVDTMYSNYESIDSADVECEYVNSALFRSKEKRHRESSSIYTAIVDSDD